MKWLLISTCVLLQIIRQVKGDGCSSEALTTGVDVVNWCNTPSIEDPDAADHEKVQYLCGVRKYYIAFLFLSFLFSSSLKKHTSSPHRAALPRYMPLGAVHFALLFAIRVRV